MAAKIWPSMAKTIIIMKWKSENNNNIKERKYQKCSNGENNQQIMTISK